MKIIKNDFIPFKGFKAINLFGVLFVRTEAEMTDEDLNHESIHTRQMKELGYLGFYVLYLLEWIAGLITGHSSFDSYRMISFEREAYSRQSDPDYLPTRKPYAQWR